MNAWNRNYEISFGRVTDAVKMLLFVTISAYLVQRLLQNANYHVSSIFGLSLGGLKHGYLWQFFSYMFLHGPFFHLLLNMLVLFMMGPETERAMGKSQFLIMYFVSGVLGGIGWLIIGAGDNPTLPCVGASGAIFGIIGAFAALFPQREITLLLFFIIPITMRAWVLALVLGGMELMFLLIHPFGGGIANAAHLAGGLAGYVYAYTVFSQGAIGWKRRGPPSWVPSRPRFRVLPGGGGGGDETPSADDMVEIDRILEKIEQEGMQSLTTKEREKLQSKSRQLRGDSRR